MIISGLFSGTECLHGSSDHSQDWQVHAEKSSNPIAQSLIDQRPKVIPEELRADFAEMP